MAPIHVFHLSVGRVAEAFPLVRISHPAIGESEWVEHGCDAIHRGGGVLGAFTEDGVMLGVAVYRPDRRLGTGLVLSVDTLVALELCTGGPVRQAICSAIELLCHGLGAPAMMLAVPARGYGDPQSPKTREWARIGLGLDSVAFSKPVASACAGDNR